jgi:hypothetical protein
MVVYGNWCVRAFGPRIWTFYVAKFKEHSPFGRAGSDSAKTSEHALSPIELGLINDQILLANLLAGPQVVVL